MHNNEGHIVPAAPGFEELMFFFGHAEAYAVSRRPIVAWRSEHRRDRHHGHSIFWLPVVVGDFPLVTDHFGGFASAILTPSGTVVANDREQDPRLMVSLEPTTWWLTFDAWVARANEVRSERQAEAAARTSADAAVTTEEVL
jgi:hypothetical protein